MEIKIGKTARSCSTCECTFEHEQRINSLVNIENHQLTREDYCDRCWNPEHALSAYSTWTLQFYDPKVAEAEPPEVFSPLRQVFYECVERDSRDELAIAYLAAQLLRRQKVFRLIKESGDSEDGVLVVLFSDRIGNRLIEVQDPNLSYDELETGRSTLMARLNELENPQPPEGEADNAELQQA